MQVDGKAGLDAPRIFPYAIVSQEDIASLPLRRPEDLRREHFPREGGEGEGKVRKGADSFPYFLRTPFDIPI